MSHKAKLLSNCEDKIYPGLPLIFLHEFVENRKNFRARGD